MTKTLKNRVGEALGNDTLRAAVKYTTNQLKTGKNRASDELGDWEQWRERARSIRAHVVEHLDYYLNEFAENVAEKGGHVYFCEDAKDAGKTILDIARKNQVKTAVKGKSMVSEEILLNEQLQEAGIEAIETDLGEYIIQLAKETPSHIIIPAIHKNREEIAELFSAQAGRAISAETKELASYAKEQLRNQFMNAELGITGCNFAIAETGAITLVSNEGNARMVSTLPKTHVVVMGMERIVPSYADVEVMLNMLARSATGQRLTTYTTFITGPKQLSEIDGPEELHVIILDHGRSEQLGDPKFQEVLHCIRCAACLNVCPVYQHIGGHAYGSVYSGPIGAVLTPLIQQDLKTAGELSYASSLCGACYDACPVKIPLHDMLVELRHEKVKAGYTPKVEQIAMKAMGKTLSHVKTYQIATNTMRKLQFPLVSRNWIRWTPAPLSAWTKSRDMKALARKSFRARWIETLSQSNLQKSQGQGGDMHEK